MSQPNAAVLAAPSNSPIEVGMHKALMITRAPSDSGGDFFVKRDGKPDLFIKNGRLLLTVETEPVVAHRLLEKKRWRVYRLYESEFSKKLVVANEGRSTEEGETTRYSAEVCANGADAWEAMGRIEELKPVFADLKWPAVEEI